jgi:hypothetical protein
MDECMLDRYWKVQISEIQTPKVKGMGRVVINQIVYILWKMNLFSENSGALFTSAVVL